MKEKAHWRSDVWGICSEKPLQEAFGIRTPISQLGVEEEREQKVKSQRSILARGMEWLNSR